MISQYTPYPEARCVANDRVDERGWGVVRREIWFDCGGGGVGAGFECELGCGMVGSCSEILMEGGVLDARENVAACMEEMVCTEGKRWGMLSRSSFFGRPGSRFPTPCSEASEKRFAMLSVRRACHPSLLDDSEGEALLHGSCIRPYSFTVAFAVSSAKVLRNSTTRTQTGTWSGK